VQQRERGEIHAIRLRVRNVLMGRACGKRTSRVLAMDGSLVFRISPLDLGTSVAVSLLLLATCGLASYRAAHRAITVDPVKALRAWS
jgi:hypothetical protein